MAKKKDIDVRNCAVKVGSWRVPISEVKKWHDEKAFGAFDPEEQTITLAPKASKSTVIHELAHAYEEALGFSVDEQVIVLIEHAIASFISDNPDFCRALIDTIVDDS